MKMLDGCYVLEVDAEGEPTQIISKEDFEARFGGATTYDDLYDHPNATPAWKAIFDELKARGELD